MPARLFNNRVHRDLITSLTRLAIQSRALCLAALWVLLLFNTAGAAKILGKGSEGSLYRTIVNNKLHESIGTKSPAMLENFYRTYSYSRFWTDTFIPRNSIIGLIEALKGADSHGLALRNYNFRKLEDKLSELVLNKWRGMPGPASLSDEVELLATDAFLTYSADMLVGRSRPESLSEDIKKNGASNELIALLYDTLSSGDIINSIEGLSPGYYEYNKLMDALARYRRIKADGGWPYVKGPLKEGTHSRRVIALRKRLEATGDLAPGQSTRSRKFDKDLKQAVIRFQKRHGLPSTGYVGRQTLGAMNVSVDKRIEIITLNMERLRWMPVYTASKLVIVNLTDFSLRLIDGKETKLKAKVIIGKQFNNTPTFTTKIYSIVLNPSWRIPRSIVIDELLPKIKADPEYLDKRKISMYISSRYKGDPVDKSTIEWSKINKSNFPYWLKRNAGPGNPLGKLKFVMPNKYSIYMHDTPGGQLFNKSVRAFSHGCIRLEKPLKLAHILLESDGWSKKKLERIIKSGREKSIALKKAVMIQLVYRTSWVDDKNNVNFRKDIYGHDDKLAAMMKSGNARPLEISAARMP